MARIEQGGSEVLADASDDQAVDDDADHADGPGAGGTQGGEGAVTDGHLGPHPAAALGEDGLDDAPRALDDHGERSGRGQRLLNVSPTDAATPARVPPSRILEPLSVSDPAGLSTSAPHHSMVITMTTCLVR